MRYERVAEHRLFFALRPPIDLARQIASAAHWFATNGHPVRADRLHLTLFLLPDFITVPAGLPDRLLRAGASIAAAPIDIVLDTVAAGRDSIALRPRRRIAALTALYSSVAARCRAEGIVDRPGHVFSPHVTLGYRAGTPFHQRIADVGWRAREVVLIHSHLGRARHEVVGRWPLDAEERQLALL